jgi:hypothetical protein
MNAKRRDGLHRRFVRTVEAAGLPTGPDDLAPVTDDDLARLPGVVQRYLRFMGVVDRPRDWSFRARFAGRVAGYAFILVTDQYPPFRLAP